MPDPQKILATIRRATTLFRATPGRRGSVVHLDERAGDVLVVGDLHGHIHTFAAGLKLAALEKKGAMLESLLREAIAARGLDGRLTIARLGSLLTLFFAGGPIPNFTSAKRSDTKRYAAFFHGMRERGVFLPPAQYEAWFVSTAHDDDAIRRTARAAGESLSVAFAN